MSESAIDFLAGMRRKYINIADPDGGGVAGRASALVPKPRCLGRSFVSIACLRLKFGPPP